MEELAAVMVEKGELVVDELYCFLLPACDACMSKASGTDGLRAKEMEERENKDDGGR